MKHSFFSMPYGSGGSKVGSLSGAETWSKNYTPLWRDADLKAKSSKHLGSDKFSKLRCRISARCFGREAHVEVKKIRNASIIGAFFGNSVAEKVYIYLV